MKLKKEAQERREKSQLEKKQRKTRLQLNGKITMSKEKFIKFNRSRKKIK